MGEFPPTEAESYWEPDAEVLLRFIRSSPVSGKTLREAKRFMRRKGYKISHTVNLLSYLSLKSRVVYDRSRAVWVATSPDDGDTYGNEA